jgi:hypothetical protein
MVSGGRVSGSGQSQSSLRTTTVQNGASMEPGIMALSTHVVKSYHSIKVLIQYILMFSSELTTEALWISSAY